MMVLQEGGKLESAEKNPEGKERTNKKPILHDSGPESNLVRIHSALTLLCQCCLGSLHIRFFNNMLFPVSGYQSVSPIFNWCYSGKFVCKGKCASVQKKVWEFQ